MAGRTMAEFTTDGFHEGETPQRAGQDPGHPGRDLDDRRGQPGLLVRSRLGRRMWSKPAPGAAGIVVVVYEETFEGRPWIVTDSDIVVCGPALWHAYGLGLPSHWAGRPCA